jgi:hypothetical protein
MGRKRLRSWTLFLNRAALYCRAAALSSGLIASAAEDDTARLWQADGTALQSIEHPGIGNPKHLYEL